MVATRGTPLQGDRATHSIADPTKHASDWEDSALQIHLPLSGAAGGHARSDGTDWQRTSEIALADLASYARGSIIRGGGADWEAYDASTLGTILAGDDTDIIATANPYISGTLTLANEGLHLFDTGGDHDLIIKPGSDLTADRIFTLTTGDVARTLSVLGNVSFTGNFTVGAATSITGGGTLALGGHVLTVPEALIAAGRNVANMFAEDQTFEKNIVVAGEVDGTDISDYVEADLVNHELPVLYST